MIRYFTIAFLILFTGSFSQAQVVLNSDMVPEYGTTIRFTYLIDPTVFEFEKTGENLIWDFTLYSTAGIDSVYYDDPANTPYFDQFPEATLAIYQDQDGIGYMKTTTNDHVLIGLAAELEGSLYVVNMNPTATLFTFPYTYGNAMVDTAAFKITDSGATFGFPLIDSVRYKVSLINDRVVTAWGTLVLPVTSYEGTLLEKNIMKRIDSLWSKLPFFGWVLMGPPDIYVDSSYRWLTDAVLHPYAELYYDEGAIGAVTHYFDNTVSTRDFITKEKMQIQVSPNPFRDRITIRADVEGNVKIMIYDLSGKEVFRNSYDVLDREINLDLGKLKQGIYNLLIITPEKQASQKLIKVGL